MKRVQLVVAFLVGWGVACWSQPAEAQRYYGRRPTLSPYLHYFRGPGPLGQYHSHVRPRVELRSTLAGQAGAIRQQQRSIGALQSEVSRFGTTGPTRATGTGSGFMNYSHYYPGGSSGGAGRSYSRPAPSGYSGSLGGLGGFGY